MAVFKCKICGGTLSFAEGSLVCECQYCGTKQTLPKTNSEQNNTLYERAEHFRRSNDFDKAISIYEQILNADNTDAEAYWSLVLCRYGVEYVEDPKSNKRIATVNRMQYTSVLADEDYKSALKYADAEQKAIYETEAKEIDAIQKGILAISQKEEPFDVFICYKETDQNGRRTPDSVLANELYHQLVNAGFKTFFSRITLEEKLGREYEPYIFAALNSAKVMVVIGTKQEYFNAVWVRNEWSRFLTLVKNGANKILIPAYRDMDPYDLPEEFSHLQAQDMSKLGFMQDLIRGIEKISAPEKAETIRDVNNSFVGNTSSLVRRGFLFLEESEWESADEYFEKVLDQEPENAQAYLGKLLIDFKINRPEELEYLTKPFDNNINYSRIIRFGDENLVKTVQKYLKTIIEKIEKARIESLYITAVRTLTTAETVEDCLLAEQTFEKIIDYKDSQAQIHTARKRAQDMRFSARYKFALGLMRGGKTASDFTNAANVFDEMPGYRDSEILRSQCLEKAQEIEKDEIYNKAIFLMSGNKVDDYKNAVSEFEKIKDYKDSAQKIEFCNNKIEEIIAPKAIVEKEEPRSPVVKKEVDPQTKNKRKKIIICVFAAVMAVAIAVTIVLLIVKNTLNKDITSEINQATENSSMVDSSIVSDVVSEAESSQSSEETSTGSTESQSPSINSNPTKPNNTSTPSTPVEVPPATDKITERIDFYEGQYSIVEKNKDNVVIFETRYDKNGNKLSEAKPTYDSTGKQCIGAMITYYENGKKIYIMESKIEQPLNSFYTAESYMVSLGCYEKNTNKFTNYNPDGSVKSVEIYKMGSKNGTIGNYAGEYYNAQGVLIQSFEFKEITIEGITQQKYVIYNHNPDGSIASTEYRDYFGKFGFE